MDSEHQKIETRFNRIIVFFQCLLIYFLPISIALVETTSGFVMFFLVLKKGLLAAHDIRRLSAAGPVSWKTKFGLIWDSCKLPQNAVNWPMGISILAVGLSVINSQYFVLSLISFFAKLLQGYLIYMSFAECINSKGSLRNFISVYCVSLLLMGVNGLTQYITHTEFVRGTPLINDRVSSSLRHANDFGAYLLFAIPLLLSMLFMPLNRLSFLQEWKTQHSFGASKAAKAAIFILLLLILACEGLTFSRGSWVGLLISLFALAVFRRRGFLWIGVVGVIFMMIFAPYLVKVRDVSFVSDNIKVQEEVDLENKKSDLESLPPLQRWITANWHHGFNGMGRLGKTGFWTEAMRIIEQHPVLGTGLNTYSRSAVQYGYPHNCFLQMAAEVGLLGLFTFLGMIAALFIYAFSVVPLVRDHFFQAVLTGSMAGLAGFFVQCFFDTSLYSVQLSNLMWIFMGLIMTVCLRARVQNN
jgi:putative inorganic carbon (hco3(-)) transporter